ncbi:S26 family signal peptidase [Nonomuraea sp. NPDC005650]|uniref:S26 family signal peptidase n=1 Tax=Nonomuraea sp. NPDC005650 TaxID=3157045 RepID=UPI0033A9695B
MHDRLIPQAASDPPAVIVPGAGTTIWLAGGLVLGSLLVATAVLTRRYAVVHVSGLSMTPTLYDGDRVLVRRTPLKRVVPGMIVVIPMPSPRLAGDPPWLVKRVAAVPGDSAPRDRFPALPAEHETVPPGRLVLLSDNGAARLDSRRMGYFNGEALLGVVVRKLRSTPAEHSS